MAPSLLQRYVLREIIPAIAISSVALLLIFFIGLSVSFTREGLSIVQLYYVIPYILMLSLPYALPVSFLVSAVLVFGRLSGRQEIDAMRAGGVNLYQVVIPPLALALSVSAGAFFLNQYLFPWTTARVRYMRNRLINDIARQVGNSRKEFRAGPYFIYVGGVDSRDGSWKNVAMIQFVNEIPNRVLVAQRGYWTAGDTQTATLTLMDGTMLEPELSIGEQPPLTSFKQTSVRVALNEPASSLDRPKYLPLGPLLNDIRERGRQAAAIRAQLPLAANHPKAARWKRQSELQKAERAYATLQGDANSRKKTLEGIRSAVDRMEADVTADRAAQESAQQRCQEAKTRLAGQPESMEKLKRDLKRRLDDGATREQVAALEAELAAGAARVSQLTARAAEAERELLRATAAREASAAKLQAGKEDLGRAEAAYNSANAAAQAAEKVVRSIKETVSRLRTVERWIDAKSEFHFRNAGAVTCFIFMLIGIPLGILSRRGAVIVAVAISFSAVLFLHYPLVMIGETLAADAYLAPWIAEWLANAVLGCIGLALLIWGVKR